ncbi:MAG TPA: GAF domain-containing protein [Kofleriaceae bacterium]|nr:GAF domain-containing protein [Kofleriaceae bacterium]
MDEQGPTRPSAVATANLERQLNLAQQITHTGSWEWDLAADLVTWSEELYRIYGLDVGRAVTFETLVAHVHPDDRDRVARHVQDALVRGGRFAYAKRVIRPDGTIRELDTIGEVLRDVGGHTTGLVGTCRDVTDERIRERELRTAQRLELGERRALELLAAGAPLREVLDLLAEAIEALDPGALVSIVIVDETGTRVRPLAGPNVPAAFSRVINGAVIGPSAGSCGTAMFRRERVIVTDIERDERWANYREFALPHGLRACWASPLFGSDGRLLGSFAVYYRAARAPEPSAIALVERATHIAGIAIERRQLDDRLRALTERVEAIREDERTQIAREVHDELGQALTALKMDIAWVLRRLPTVPGNEPLAAKLAEMARSADAIIGSVRRISAELRPGILDDLGLSAAIEWQLEEFAKRTGIVTNLDSTLGEPPLERALATTLFRIFQEALTNVARHAGAATVTVRLGLDHGQVRLEVEDDGVGIPVDADKTSLGLLGMCERARRLGGDCEVRRCGARGTVVSVSVPLRTSTSRRTDADTPIGT